VLIIAVSALDCGDSAVLDFAAGGVHDRADHRELPGGGKIAREDVLFLAAFDQGLELVEPGDVAPVDDLRSSRLRGRLPARAVLLRDIARRR